MLCILTEVLINEYRIVGLSNEKPVNYMQYLDLCRIALCHYLPCTAKLMLTDMTEKHRSLTAREAAACIMSDSVSETLTMRRNY